MSRQKRNIFIVLFITIFLVCGFSVSAREYYTGAVPVTDDELDRMIEIIDVKLNEKGIGLIENNTKVEAKKNNSKLESVDIGNELITSNDEKTINSLSEDYLLPTAVDLSENDTFPPIGNQSTSPSCVAWSLGYYQLSNNIANVRGTSPKINVSERISPRWIFNVAHEEEGENYGGLYYTTVMDLMSNFGAPTWNICNGTTTGGDPLSWFPFESVWEQALSNRLDGYYIAYISRDGGKTINLDVVKKLLMNGYAVSFSTYIYRWKIDKRIMSPISKKSEWICTHQNQLIIGEDNGAHALTIVGYDDSIEIDINGDGVVDSKEALKIANSWGTGWEYGNKGFIWLAYDALYEKSNVMGVSDNHTGAISSNVVYFLKPKIEYVPLLLAKVEIETSSRRQLRIQVGISGKETDRPEKIVGLSNEHVMTNTMPFDLRGISTDINYNFSGISQKGTGTFIFDLTPMIMEYWKENTDKVGSGITNNFYVKISEARTDSYLSKVKKFSIIDRINGKTYTSQDFKEATVNGSSIEYHVPCDIVPFLIEEGQNINLKFNYPIKANSSDQINISESGNINVNLQTVWSSDRKRAVINHSSQKELPV